MNDGIGRSRWKKSAVGRKTLSFAKAVLLHLKLVLVVGLIYFRVFFGCGCCFSPQLDVLSFVFRQMEIMVFATTFIWHWRTSRRSQQLPNLCLMFIFFYLLSFVITAESYPKIPTGQVFLVTSSAPPSCKICDFCFEEVFPYVSRRIHLEASSSLSEVFPARLCVFRGGGGDHVT